LQGTSGQARLPRELLASGQACEAGGYAAKIGERDLFSKVSYILIEHKQHENLRKKP